MRYTTNNSIQAAAICYLLSTAASMWSNLLGLYIQESVLSRENHGFVEPFGHLRVFFLNLVSAVQSVRHPSVPSFSSPENCNSASVGLQFRTTSNHFNNIGLVSSSVKEETDSSKPSFLTYTVCKQKAMNRINVPRDALNMVCGDQQMLNTVVGHCETVGGLNQLATQQHLATGHNFKLYQLKRGRSDEPLNLTA